MQLVSWEKTNQPNHALGFICLFYMAGTCNEATEESD